MSRSFEGKVVLVTGANTGIGEAAAVAYQEAGATVFGVVRRKESLEASRARHPNIKWVLFDVSKNDDVTKGVQAVVSEAGRLDVVVNNAAIFTFSPLKTATESDIRSQFEINVLGTSFVSKAALPALEASRGTILNISSAVGHKAAPGGSHYGATKAAVESMTRSWALELAPSGIRVNAVAPGPTETEGFSKMGGSPEAQAAMKDAFVKQVPLGRMANTAEVVHWILALTDPKSTWMTGEVLAIDGGMSL